MRLFLSFTLSFAGVCVFDFRFGVESCDVPVVFVSRSSGGVDEEDEDTSFDGGSSSDLVSSAKSFSCCVAGSERTPVRQPDSCTDATLKPGAKISHHNLEKRCAFAADTPEFNVLTNSVVVCSVCACG